LQAATHHNKSKNTRENDHGNARQTSAYASSEIVMLIRKLRWVGLDEKAEQLEKELEQRAVTDRVIPMQNDTD
jgi:membrane carboxypeptidase/penicillin-binding protein